MGVHDSVSVVGFIGFLSLQLPLYQFHFKKETYFQLLRKEAHNFATLQQKILFLYFGVIVPFYHLFMLAFSYN